MVTRPRKFYIYEQAHIVGLPDTVRYMLCCVCLIITPARDKSDGHYHASHSAWFPFWHLYAIQWRTTRAGWREL